MHTAPTPEPAQRLAYTPPSIVDLEALEETEAKTTVAPIESGTAVGPS